MMLRVWVVPNDLIVTSCVTGDNLALNMRSVGL